MKSCQSANCFYPIFSHGYCKFHQGLRKDEKYLNGRKSIIQKHFEKMKQLGLVNKNGGLIVSKSDEFLKEQELQKWFDEGMKLDRICENCGKSLKHYNEKDFRGSQHHVLEKSLYPSVAANSLNRLILGKWCCHHVWHQSFEKASQMRIFPKAISIIEKLYPLLTREEKRKLPEIVLQELNIGHD